MRKMGDVISSCRKNLQKRIENFDVDNSGVVSAAQFSNAMENACAHMFRSEEVLWVLKKIQDMQSTGVNYRAFLDAVDSYRRNQDTKGDSYDSWVGVGDRSLMTKLHESSGAKIESPNSLRKSRESVDNSNSPQRRLDPWGRPLG